jgi:hypothetical protein
VLGQQKMGGYRDSSPVGYLNSPASFLTRYDTSTAFQRQPKNESSEACLYMLFCLTGMGAISAAILSSMGSGDVVIAQHDVYGGTFGFLKSDLPRFGATVLFEDTNNLNHLEKLLFGQESVSSSGTLDTSGKEASSQLSNAEEEQCSNGERCLEEPTVIESFVNGGAHKEVSDRDRGVEASTSGSPAWGGLAADIRGKGGRVVIFVETVSNPLLVVSDVRAIAALSKRAGALLIVDNTFGTPLRSRPLSEVRKLDDFAGFTFSYRPTVLKFPKFLFYFRLPAEMVSRWVPRFVFQEPWKFPRRVMAFPSDIAGRIELS